MNFELNNEQKELVAQTIAFTKSHLNTEEDLDEFSYDMWKKTAEFGTFLIWMMESVFLILKKVKERASPDGQRKH